MSETQPPTPPSGDQPQKPNEQDQQTYSQKFNHAPVAARVPEKIGRGVFTTGVLVQDGPGEFVLDFLQGLAKPPTIAARVILSPITMNTFVSSLRNTLDNFSKVFGPPQPLPKPPTQHRPTIQELYEHFKLPEELMSGVYANSFLIAHGPAEFAFDFITGFFPTACVSTRAYISAQQIPRMLETLSSSLVQHQQRFGTPHVGQQPPPHPAPPAPDAPPSGEPHG